jgi:GMP reductase
MKIETDIKLDFQDVLLRPKRSTLSSRSEVDLERTLFFPHSKHSWTGVPIMVANMDTTGTPEMYMEVVQQKMITVFHKHIDVQNILNFNPEYYALSTGISDNDYLKLNENVDTLKEKGRDVKFICIDVANGYMEHLVYFCKIIRKTFPDQIIIAGNVVSREMVEELIINGTVDIVKVGIGSGSVCTTRLQTGVGMPQLSAVIECADAAHGCGGHIISDGGIVNPGDIGKAFGGGADFVMMGSMFAGHDESAGELVEENGKKYKIFYGMSSEMAMGKYNGGVANYRSSEGKTVKIEYRGPVSNTIQNILGGLRSTCTYIGARRLKDISKCATFLRVNHIVNNVYS